MTLFDVEWRFGRRHQRRDIGTVSSPTADVSDPQHFCCVSSNVMCKV